ncbi:MAG: 16S rRNA (guanine(527)-N(7))-methyltransferase RsmG [Desulfobacca sp.]|uniref:16S rRNA (guanine(527)-N(7))-methyltransferase RsmG n=1 Tax=Desulfobacca sp. TaxID=2067990 RepID=UPI004049CF7E
MTEVASDPADLLQEGAVALGLRLAPDVLGQFLFYGEALLRWNRHVNLTALRTLPEVVLKHFLDSLAVWPWVQDLASLADVGTGAGFPGVPLKLVLPQLALTLVEANGKKTAFLHYLVAHLQLQGVSVRQLHLTPRLACQWGPIFQGVITRATLPLDRYMDLAAPLVRPGGRLLAMQGPHLDAAPWQRAAAAAARNHCGPPSLQEYRLPGSGAPRRLVIWEKLPA